MPLPIHKDAFRASVATHCAEDQGKFWEMHDRLFDNQRAIEPLKGHAEALGLDVVVFESCMASEKHAEAVRKDMAQAQKAGATGTPSFVLGRTDPADPSKGQGDQLYSRRPAVRGLQDGDRKSPRRNREVNLRLRRRRLALPFSSRFPRKNGWGMTSSSRSSCGIF